MRLTTTVPGALLALLALSASAAQLTEGFNDVSSLTATGWTIVNNSSPNGTNSWFQGNIAAFPAQAGPTNSYVAANFNAAEFGGVVSLWLITPTITLANGVQLTFYTRTADAPFGIDQLEVRASFNGPSANVGNLSGTVGDFGSLLLTINPSPATLDGYPTSWTQYTVTLSGLAGPVTGRFAFRYLVEDTSTDGEYIGIDSLTVSDVGGTPSTVPEPLSAGLAGLGLGAMAMLARRRPNS